MIGNIPQYVADLFCSAVHLVSIMRQWWL